MEKTENVAIQLAGVRTTLGPPATFLFSSTIAILQTFRPSRPASDDAAEACFTLKPPDAILAAGKVSADSRGSERLARPACTAAPPASSTTTTTITTAITTPHIPALSPPALEKKAGQDWGLAATRDLPLRAPWPGSSTLPQPDHPAARPPPRSFLDIFLARPPPRGTPRHTAAASASRVLNPLNHVPRATPVQVTRGGASEIAPELHETGSLLTLPEKRRSRQNSPNTPLVEHSPGLDPSSSNRTSIALPATYQRSPLISPQAADDMIDPEKSQEGVREPEKVVVPTSRYNTKGRDLEAGLPSGQSILGQTYGVSREDRPLHPPRKITSSHSLRKAQSIASFRSASYAHAAPNEAEVEADDAANEANQADDEEGSLSEELAWGPSHPCYPHLNSHVPVTSLDYQETRIVRIRRDWMVKGDLAPTYSNLYPEILDPILPEQEFRNVIQRINQTLIETFDPFSTWNWIDGVLGLATGWLWEDFRPGGVKAKLRNLEAWIQEWNRTVGQRDGVRIIPLQRTGYMNLDIQIPDPHIQMVKDDSRPGTADGP